MVESLLNPRGDEITGSSVQSDRRDRDPNTCSDHAISSPHNIFSLLEREREREREREKIVPSRYLPCQKRGVRWEWEANQRQEPRQRH